MLLTVVILALPQAVLGQPIFGSATSIDCVVLDADTVVVGRPVLFSEPDEAGWSEGIVEVQETLKGQHRPRVPVRLAVPKASLKAWTNGTSRILFATKLDSPATTTAIDLDADELTVFSKSFERLTKAADVLQAARGALRKRPGVTRITSVSLLVPHDRLRGTKLAEYSGVHLAVPVDSALEAWAKKAIRGDANRRTGVEILRHFRSSENVSLVRSLLDDPTWTYLDRAEDNEGREVRLFAVREAACETLRYWGEPFEVPVLRQQSTKLDRVKLISRSNTKVDTAALRGLARFTNLESLFLWNTNVTDDHLQEIVRLENLRELYLGGTEVTDAGLSHLAKLPKLRYLDLAGTAVTDAGLTTLATFESLEKLSLDNVDGVTEAGLARLAEKRSDVKIER